MTALHVFAQLYYRPDMDDELPQVIQGREGWTWAADGSTATFRHASGAWGATVRQPATPPKRWLRWFISGVHPDGNSAWSTYAGSPLEAVRLAEAWVKRQEDR